MLAWLTKLKKPVNRHDVIICTVLILLIVILLLVSPHLPDERPGAIRRELKKQGYEVEGIDFAYVMDGERYREWIYESSVPIYYKGEYVSQWSLFSYSISSPIVRYYVQPYPPVPEPVTVHVTFTAEEYGRIVQSAEERSAEDYIRQIVLGNVIVEEREQ